MIRQVNEKATGKGVKLREERSRMWEIKQVKYSKSREDLQHIVEELRVCERMSPRINTN